MFVFLQGKVAIGLSHRQFRGIKSDCFFDVLCAETVLISLPWRHSRDDCILTVLEEMVSWILGRIHSGIM